MNKNNLKKKILSNNKGVALVTVVVAIGFVAAIVSILLLTTLVNFKMKATNEKSKKTFYSAEMVLDEINVGLQRKVSDAISSSYIEVLENYGDYDNEKKQEMMMTRYYEKLWASLEDVTKPGHATYDVNILESMLRSSTRWHTEDGVGYGAIITAISEDGTESKSGDMFTYTKEGVILKNLKVYYKDSMGFVSVIQTDIRLAYPEFEFATSSMIADITEYSFIADSGFETNCNGTMEIDGNVYANNFKADGTEIEVASNKKFITKYNLDINDGKFIIKEDTSGTEVVKDVNLWAKNIIAKGSEIDVDGSITVSNDLVLAGKNSKVKIAGNYVGYGCSNNDADKSSAVLVNGTNATIDMSKLRSFTVAGHAYVGTSGADKDLSDFYQSVSTIYKTNPERPETMEELKDVFTGQSLAVKSDQLCYLVPAEAIGVDNNTGRSMFNKNPLTKAEFKAIKDAIKDNEKNNTEYVMISDEVTVTALGENLGYFLKTSRKLGETKATPDYKHVEIRVDDPDVESLVYMYMEFETPQKADDYFGLYYANNKDTVEKYTKLYLDDVVFPKNTSQLLTYITASNIMVSNDDDGFDLAAGNISNTLESSEEEYDLKFKALCTKLVENYNELSTLNGGLAGVETTLEKEEADPLLIKKNRKLFDNIVDITKLDQFCEDAYQMCTDAGLADGTEMVMPVSGMKVYPSRATHCVKFIDSVGNIAYVFDSDASGMTINEADAHLVICASESATITIGPTFKSGLILCNGKVNTTGSAITLKSDPEKVRTLLQAGYEKDGYSYAIASVLTDGSDFVSRIGSGDDAAMDTSMSGLITYENWKKE